MPITYVCMHAGAVRLHGHRDILDPALGGQFRNFDHSKASPYRRPGQTPPRASGANADDRKSF